MSNTCSCVELLQPFEDLQKESFCDIFRKWPLYLFFYIIEKISIFAILHRYVKFLSIILFLVANSVLFWPEVLATSTQRSKTWATYYRSWRPLNWQWCQVIIRATLPFLATIRIWSGFTRTIWESLDHWHIIAFRVRIILNFFEKFKLFLCDAPEILRLE